MNHWSDYLTDSYLLKYETQRVNSAKLKVTAAEHDLERAKKNLIELESELFESARLHYSIIDITEAKEKYKQP